MAPPNPYQASMVGFSLLAVVWIAYGLIYKPVARREDAGSRTLHLVFVSAAFILLFNRDFSTPALDRRWLVQSPAIAWTSIVFTLAGIFLAIWARLVLGSNWSASVTLKQGHELMCSGPYGLVRHPIYTGILTALVGTVLAVGEMHSLAGFACVVVGFWLKLRKEEEFMTQQFGEQYADYRRHVKALIPFVV